MLVAVHSTFTFAQQDPSLQTVMAEGVGTSMDTALQNAAQNALTNVVGSFIDANKILEKRVQIKEGIREQTTFIRNDIKEYSQGWIKNIQVLESSSESGLFRVTAKVTIKNEAFKIFAKKLAQAEAPVDQGLFAAMAVEIKQGENLKKLLDDIVSPLLLGEVYDFKILALRPLRDIDDRQIGRDIISSMTDKVDRSNIFFFDVEMNVKDDYKKSIVNIFESTAKKKISLGAITQISEYFDSIPEMRSEQAKLEDQDLGNSVIYFVHNKKMDAYIFDVPKKKFYSDFEWLDFFGQWRNGGLFIPYRYKKPAPQLQVKLLNDNGDEIVAHRLAYPYTGKPRNNNDFGIVLTPRFEQSDGNRNCRYPCEQPLIGSQLLYPPNNSRHVIDLDVRKIRVFLAIGDKERASRKIMVEFMQ
jgi:hypothetical protein